MGRRVVATAWATMGVLFVLSAVLFAQPYLGLWREATIRQALKNGEYPPFWWPLSWRSEYDARLCAAPVLIFTSSFDDQDDDFVPGLASRSGSAHVGQSGGVVGAESAKPRPQCQGCRGVEDSALKRCTTPRPAR